MGTVLRQKLERLRINSLRARYLAVAVVLAVIVLTSAVMANFYVDHAGHSSMVDMEGRNDVLHISRLIRNSVWDAEFALQAHGLSPTPELAVDVGLKIEMAIYQASYLINMPWIKNDKNIPIVEDLIRDFNLLNQETTELMRIRENNELLYPAMKIMVEEMLPLNIAFYTAASLAMDEYNPRTNKNALNIHLLFSEVRHHWTRMVSVFRVYAANRTGIFGDIESGLQAQSANLEIFYRELLQRLNYIIRLRDAGVLDLQASESATKMLPIAIMWYGYFQEVKKINNSPDWRADMKIVRDQIRPLLASIRESLIVLDKQIEQSTHKDMSTWVGVAEAITYSFWTLAIVALSFIVFGYLAFAKSVLHPIGLVAKALTAESTGGSSVKLPDVKTQETKDLVTAFSNMRKQVHVRQMQLEHQALHDALTGLPNRKFILNKLISEIESADDNHSLALLVMDLDRFKEINDTLGHHVGDEVLKRVGERLVRLMDKDITISRLGGDEFAFVVSNLEHHTQAVNVAEETIEALEQIVEIEHYRIYVGASVGIAYYPQHGKDANTLIQRADVAMYEAKKSACGYAVYDLDKDQNSVGRLAIVRDLKNAIDDNSLCLHFQPKSEVASGEVLGVEALLRWSHPELGIIPPEEIVEVAEQTGLIRPLTNWVLNTAIYQCAQWLIRGIHARVAVNLSVKNLQDKDLTNEVKHLLNVWQVPPSYLELEITESAMMADPIRAVEVLKELDIMGIHLSVDDFGTGFSSLAYLKSLPVDELKIHKSFVVDMCRVENDAVIVKSTIDLAHNLGLKVIAEGVQDKQTWEMLSLLGCDTIQGYYISCPLTAKDLEDWLRKNQWDTREMHA